MNIRLIAISLLLAPCCGSAAEPLPELPTVNEEIVKRARSAPLSMLFKGETSAELAKWQEEFREKLRKLVGPHAPPKDWRVKRLGIRELVDHVREEVLLESEGVPSLPLYVLRPKGVKGRLPIILALHGHGRYGHDVVAGVDDTQELRDAIVANNYDYGRQLVREGYLVVVPCLTPFGRRLDDKTRSRGTDPCALEFVRLMFLGKTLIGENVRDAIWAINYASRREDARADRIGCVGLSYGGRMTMLVTALESRIDVAVISGALNVYQERVMGSGYSCGAQVIPGILEYGDTPEIGSLIAPRPVIWEVGSRDKLAVPGWREKAEARLQEAYQASGRPENLQIHRFEGGHEWSGTTAVPLLERVLKR